MNALAIFEWAASNINQADDLLDELSQIKAPPPFGPFVDATYPPAKRIATIADAFPADALKAMPAEEHNRRLAAAQDKLKAIGDGKLLDRLRKAIPVILQIWQMYQEFKRFVP